MENSVIIEIMQYAGMGIGGIIFCYCIFWLFLVNDTCISKRLGDIGWKRVDYAWIIIGSMGLILQFIQVGLDSKLSSLKTEKIFGQFHDQNLNIAAGELSDAEICLQPLTGSGDATINSFKDELAEACNSYQNIKPANSRSTKIDYKILMHMDSVNLDTTKVKSPMLIQRIEQFNQAYKAYDQQRDKIQKANYRARTYKIYVDGLKIIAALLLVAAIALRLSKVTGEIRLKRHPLEIKSSNSISTSDLKDAIENLATATQLKKLEEIIIKNNYTIQFKLHLMLMLASTAVIGTILSFIIRAIPANG